MSTIVHTVRPIDVDIDTAFLQSIRLFVESSNPDAVAAWKKIWKTTWRVGSCIETASGSRGIVSSIDKANQTVNVDHFDGLQQVILPLPQVRRVFLLGEEVVIAFGAELAQEGHVLRHSDDATVFLRIWCNDHRTNLRESREVAVPSIYLLDREEHAVHLQSKTSNAQLRSVPSVERYDGRCDALVVGGMFKGYRGMKVNEGNNTYKIEISGLVGNKQADILKDYVLL